MSVPKSSSSNNTTLLFSWRNNTLLPLFKKKSSIKKKRMKMMKMTRMRSRDDDAEDDDFVGDDDTATIQRQDQETLRCKHKPLFRDDKPFLPQKIFSNVEGTWAFDTVSRRLHVDILERVFKDNAKDILKDASSPACKKLRKLQWELEKNEKVTYVEEDGGEDVETWKALMREHVQSKTRWRDIPWLDAEFYFYRRVLSAIGYFDAKSENFGKDPFKKDKRRGLEASLKPAVNLAKKLKSFDARKEADLRSMVFVSLWGNRADLSIWAAEDAEKAAGEYESGGSDGEDEDKKNKNALLTDDSKALCAYLASGELKGKSVSLVVDNAGFELVCDLALADALTAVCDRVVLRVKAHPTFVSDATVEDVWEHVDFLESASSSSSSISSSSGSSSSSGKSNKSDASEEGREKSKDVEARRKMASRWKSHLLSGRWVVEPDFAWCQPQPFWNLPALARASLSSELNDTGLTIIKGDANYRRLLGDRLFDHSKDAFEDVVAYFPSPVVALRSLKSELGCGMPKEKCESARNTRKDWMTCGVYGVVQFVRHPVQQTAVADAVVNQADPFADSHELQKVLVAIANACAEISERVAAQPTLSPSERGYTGETNESGDVQKKLDVFCDDVFEKHLIERLHNNERSVVKAYFSEERSEKMAKSGAAEDDFIDFGASFVVVADPLDGSRNADINIPVGSIFGIYQFKNNEKLEDVVLKPGRELIAAGYAHYGKATSFICVPGPNANACEFCLDEKTKEFKLVKDKITIPERGQVYSLNDAREPDWPSGLKKYIDDVRRGDGESGKKYSARYICALTADFHRTIQEGGWCGNPRSHLRVVYECNPLAFVAKACGGRASDGERDILDILPADFHEKTPLFAGSSEDIDEIEKYENVKQTEGGGYLI